MTIDVVKVTCRDNDRATNKDLDRDRNIFKDIDLEKDTEKVINRLLDIVMKYA